MEVGVSTKCEDHSYKMRAEALRNITSAHVFGYELQKLDKMYHFSKAEILWTDWWQHWSEIAFGRRDWQFLCWWKKRYGLSVKEATRTSIFDNCLTQGNVAEFKKVTSLFEIKTLPDFKREHYATKVLCHASIEMVKEYHKLYPFDVAFLRGMPILRSVVCRRKIQNLEWLAELGLNSSDLDDAVISAAVLTNGSPHGLVLRCLRDHYGLDRKLAFHHFNKYPTEWGEWTENFRYLHVLGITASDFTSEILQSIGQHLNVDELLPCLHQTYCLARAQVFQDNGLLHGLSTHPSRIWETGDRGRWLFRVVKFLKDKYNLQRSDLKQFPDLLHFYT